MNQNIVKKTIKKKKTVTENKLEPMNKRNKNYSLDPHNEKSSKKSELD